MKEKAQSQRKPQKKNRQKHRKLSEKMRRNRKNEEKSSVIEDKSGQEYSISEHWEQVEEHAKQKPWFQRESDAQREVIKPK